MGAGPFDGEDARERASLPASESGRARNSIDLALLGGAATAGWVLHDVATFLVSGEPAVVQQLLPASGIAVLLGVVGGGLLGLSRLLAAALGLACLAAGVVPALADADVSVARAWLPRALFLLWSATLLAAALHRRSRLGRLRLGLAVGVLACTVQTIYRHGLLSSTVVLLAAVSVALGAGLFARPAVRRGGAALAIVGAACWLGFAAVTEASLERADLPPPDVAARADAPNLLLIVLDTVRADHLAPYGYERVTTPGLDEFVAERTEIWVNARATSSWTLPSHASLFTGLLSAQHGATLQAPESQPIRDDLTTLAERLRAVGYETSGIAANSAYLRPEYGIDRGFEHFDHRWGSVVGSYQALVQLAGFAPAAGHKGYRDAERITDDALAWLDRRRGGPFFLFLNYFDAHWPYIPRPPFDGAFDDARPEDPYRPSREITPLLYDRELLFLDAHLTRLLDEVRSRGLLEETVVVVTSDHGEGLGDHGFMRHGWMLYEELVRVPLYVRPVRPVELALRDEAINGAEVHDLVLRELGLPAPGDPDPDPGAPPTAGMVAEWYVNRKIEWDEVEGRDRSVDLISWMQDGKKYIVSSKGEVEAYDLESDPHELSALQLQDEEIAEAAARARAWWDAHPILEATVERSGEDVERMRQLGYMGDV